MQESEMSERKDVILIVIPNLNFGGAQRVLYSTEIFIMLKTEPVNIPIGPFSLPITSIAVSYHFLIQSVSSPSNDGLDTDWIRKW